QPEGCSNTHTGIVLSDPNAPTVDAGNPQTICQGEEVTLTANNPDNAIINWDKNVNDNTPFKPTETTTYTVTANLAGCITSDQVTVTVNNTPNLIITNPDPICPLTRIDITNPSLTLNSTSLGINNYFTNSNATTNVLDPTNIGQGTYYVVTTTPQGCRDTASITVIESAMQEIIIKGNNNELTNNQINTSSFDNTDFGNVEVVNGLSSRVFWIVNNGSCQLSVGTINSDNNDFEVTQVINSTLGSGDSTSFEITFNPNTLGIINSSISITNDDNNQSPFTFNVAGNSFENNNIIVEGNNEVLVNGQTSISSTNNTYFGNIELNDEEISKTFWIINNGISDIVINSITINQELFTISSIDSLIIPGGDSTSFTIEFEPELGIHESTISINNSSNTFTFNVKAEVYEISEVLEIYGGFSPDNNGQNDTWIIKNIELFPENSVKIFNRWGNLVWTSSNYDNETNVWKGESNQGIKVGNQLPDGTYFYIINYKDANGIDQTRSGYVLITTNR
ncbi:MAG: choice-of-anchor D domain-containing protein, partial [Cytophagales bacterium]|nr:choice-of-anchor D domain-containing protein [Cytophagales bacterium]